MTGNNPSEVVTRSSHASRRTSHRVAAGALIVGAIAIAAVVAWQQDRLLLSTSPPSQAPTPASASSLPPAVTIGSIDAPAGEAIVGTEIHVSGWALAPDGIGRVEVRVDGRPYAARYGIARADVAREKPGFPDTAAAGFAFDGNFSALDPERHDVAVIAVSRTGRETVIGRRGLVPPVAMAQWKS